MGNLILNWKNKGNYFKFNENKIFYIVEGNGPALLILHGYPYNSYEWVGVWDELISENTVITLDYLGMGFSDKPKNHNYSYKEQCNIINNLLQFLKIEELHILSHDLGVSMAQEIIARDLQNKNCFKINSVAFMNGGLFMDVYNPRFIQRLLSQSPEFIGKIISQIITRKQVNRSVKKLFGPYTQPDKKLLDILWLILNYHDGKSITYLIGKLIFDKKNHQKKWINAMKTTKIPMCYICGPFDPNSGINMANKYSEIIKNPNVIMLEKHIGHWPHLEDPVSFINNYRNFRMSINT